VRVGEAVRNTYSKKKEKILKVYSRTRWVGGGANPTEAGITVINNFFLSCKVRGQKDSPDGGFRAKFTIFNRTIPNTV